MLVRMIVRPAAVATNLKGEFGESLRCCIAAYKSIAPMQPPRASSKFPL